MPSILVLLYRFRMTGAPLARHTPLNTLDCLQVAGAEQGMGVRRR